jgi:hypothetical protein
MDSLRILTPERVQHQIPCSRCGAAGLGWDRIMDKAYCPDCEESLIRGEADPLVERVEQHRCCICHQPGTLRYLTFPLQSTTPIEIQLCGRHVRDLLGRRLDVPAFQNLRRQLRTLRLEVGAIFLLHDAFYDADGNALQPAAEPE